MRMTFALLELAFISSAFVLCSVATHAAVTLTSPPSGAEFVAPAEVLLAEGTSAPEPSTTNTVIATGSAWNYLDDGSNQGTAWIAPEFDDSAWKTGPAQLGYGDGDEATVIGFGPDPNNKFVTSYFRRQFNIEDPALVESLTLNLLRDDGAIAYINGEEVFRLSMPAGPVDYRTYATTASEYGFETTQISPSLLRTGTNVVAVEIHQGNAPFRPTRAMRWKPVCCQPWPVPWRRSAAAWRLGLQPR